MTYKIIVTLLSSYLIVQTSFQPPRTTISRATQEKTIRMVMGKQQMHEGLKYAVQPTSRITQPLATTTQNSPKHNVQGLLIIRKMNVNCPSIK